MKRWKRRFSESFLRPPTNSRDETPSPCDPSKSLSRVGRPASLVLQGSATNVSVTFRVSWYYVFGMLVCQ